MTTNVITFEEALDDARNRSLPRAVLLGNGFSIEWDADTFRYKSLYDEAELDGLAADKQQLFDSMGTTDFERVVEFLNKAAALADLYASSDADFAARLRADADVVRNGLAEVIAARHPRRPQNVDDADAEMARRFLGEFGTIFTVNYDLLLYWVLLRQDNTHYWPPYTDGFQWPTFAGPRDRLIFKRALANSNAEVFWLHGGLHLYMEDQHVYKLSYNRAPLVDQLTINLGAGKYPLVVTEGSSAEKRARIGGNDYLSYANNRFREMEGCLFIHGMSLSDNDDHLLEALSAKESDVEVIYVGVHGDPTSRENRRFIERAEAIAEARKANKGRDLEVQFYDSASAHVWR